MSPAVVLEHRGPALWARLSRPEQGNACGPETIAGLHAWLAAGAADPAVRVLVLTGSGSSFCAGADMRAGAPLLDDRAALLRQLRHGRDLVDAIAAAPRPVVAAVNGVAAAGGFELTLAADLEREWQALSAHVQAPGFADAVRRFLGD